LVPHEIAEEIAADTLTDAGLHAGLHLAEVKQTLRSGMKAGRANPRYIEPWKPPGPVPKQAPVDEIEAMFRKHLGSRVIDGATAHLEIETAWILASVSEIQAQRDVVVSWDHLADRVDIPFVMEMARAIRAAALDKHPDADLDYAVAVFKTKIKRAIKEQEKLHAE
jgi:hypothetical protein